MDVITIETPSLGDRSYLVHDGEVALVIDPQRDVDRVLAAAEEAGTRSTSRWGSTTRATSPSCTR